MLKRVRVRGYKCLHDVSVELGPFTVLIGQNDSGKSAFLQAISEPSRVWLQGKRSESKDVSKHGWTVRLDAVGEALIYDENNAFLPRFGTATQAEEDTPPQTHFATVEEAQKWLTAHPAFHVSDPVRLDAERISQDSRAGDGETTRFIAARGQGTGAHLAALALGDRVRFDAVESALRDVTGGRVKNIVVRDLGSSFYALHFRLADREIPAVHLSQGLLTYLGFLALLHRDPMPSVVLIEEPENGLHPLRLHELVQLLRTLNARGTQLVLTTHSPDLLSACDPSEVRVFRRPAPGSPTEVHTLPKDFARRAMRDPLGQVWASRGEEGLLDLMPDAIEPAVRADSE